MGKIHPSIIIRDKKLAASIALLAFLVFILFHTIYSPETTTRARQDDMAVKLVKLFARTTVYLNYTSVQGVKTYYGITRYVSIRSDIESLLKEYSKFQRIYIYAIALKKSLSTLEKEILYSFNSYYKMANATNLMDYVDSMIDRDMPLIKKSMKLLRECRINESLNIYHSIKYDVERALKNLSKIISILKNIDNKTLLNNKHRELVSYAVNVSNITYTGLYRYKRIMETVEQYRMYYEKLCSIAHGGKEKPDDKTRETGEKLLGIIGNGEMGDATSEAQMLKIMIMNALTSNNTNMTGGSGVPLTGPANEQGGGEGAGYYNYTRTD